MAVRNTKSKNPINCLCIVLVLTSAGCSKSTTGFYPLEAGRWWYFRTETTVLDEHLEQRFLIANLGDGNFADTRVSIQRQSSGREVYLKRTSRGIERVGVRVAFDEPSNTHEPTLVLPADPESSSSWTIRSQLALIESRTFARQDTLRPLALPVELTMSVTATNDTIEVPAGRFGSCLRLDGTGSRNVKTDRGNATAEVIVTVQEWYAPSIGLIKSNRLEISDSPFLKPGRYSQELLKFGR